MGSIETQKILLIGEEGQQPIVRRGEARRHGQLHGLPGRDRGLRRRSRVFQETVVSVAPGVRQSAGVLPIQARRDGFTVSRIDVRILQGAAHCDELIMHDDDGCVGHVRVGADLESGRRRAGKGGKNLP